MPDPLTPVDWMTVWAETQKELLRHGVTGMSAGPTATATAAAEGRAAGAETIRRLIAFGDDYLGVTRALWKLIESGKARPDAPQSLRAGLEELRTTFKDRFAKLYLPAFEPLGAQQEAHERLVAVTARWQRAAQQLSERLAVVAADAVDRLAAALTGTVGGGPQVTSLRELHGLWVDCGERAYAAAAHGDDFAAAQAELLAAMVEVRFEQRRQMEEWARAFNLPARAEIDAIHERLHVLRRRVTELERELERREELRR